jgi:O-antigen/teichoic acid export membrane protein
VSDTAVIPDATTMSSAPKPRSLRERILSAGSWAMFGYACIQVLRLGSNLIMTRLLAPELFGMMAVTLSITIVVALLSDVGIRQAVVQSKRGDSPEMLGTAFTMQAVRGVLMWLVCIVVALVLDQFRRRGAFAPDAVYASPDLAWVIVVATATLLTNGLNSTKLMLADRALDLKRVALIEIASLVSTVVVMIVLASTWKNIWPLLIGTHVGALVTLALSHFWLHGPRDRLRWDAGCAAEIIGIGRWILASSALYVLSSNGDRLMLAAWMTQAQLGFYAIALTLAQAVEMAVGRLTLSVAVPAFAEVMRRDPAELPKVFWKMRMPLDAVALAVSGLLFGLGQVIVAVLYDSRYQDAGHILQILACALVLTRYGVSVSAYIAMGTTKYMPVINFVKLVALFTAMPLGYHLWGLDGVYWAIALHLLATLPLYFVYNRRHGLWDWKREAMLLAIWPVAWGVGWLLAQAAHRWLGV